MWNFVCLFLADIVTCDREYDTFQHFRSGLCWTKSNLIYADNKNVSISDVSYV